MAPSRFGYREIAAATGKTYTWADRQRKQGQARARKLAGTASSRI